MSMRIDNRLCALCRKPLDQWDLPLDRAFSRMLPDGHATCDECSAVLTCGRAEEIAELLGVASEDAEEWLASR
ncbi:MAG: hypothetical protein J2P48_18640 [Alphaproteobacteria bacterium]|nr:hypothetical protein [Alphaproteobacteria bacterium]